MLSGGFQYLFLHVRYSRGFYLLIMSSKRSGSNNFSLNLMGELEINIKDTSSCRREKW